MNSTDLVLIEKKSLNNIRAEIESLLMAFEQCPQANEVIVYTDCSTICGLPERRSKLEKNNFISAAKGTELKNADLYKQFYKYYDQLSPKLIWVKGHMAKDKQSLINKNFSVLDKAVRSKLRQGEFNS